MIKNLKIEYKRAFFAFSIFVLNSLSLCEGSTGEMGEGTIKNNKIGVQAQSLEDILKNPIMFVSWGNLKKLLAEKASLLLQIDHSKNKKAVAEKMLDSVNSSIDNTKKIIEKTKKNSPEFEKYKDLNKDFDVAEADEYNKQLKGRISNLENIGFIKMKKERTEQSFKYCINQINENNNNKKNDSPRDNDAKFNQCMQEQFSLLSSSK
jgi:hypothetical protein